MKRRGGAGVAVKGGAVAVEGAEEGKGKTANATSVPVGGKRTP